MPRLLRREDATVIRQAIDVSIGLNELPDDVIWQDIYAGASEREVLAEVSDAASKTGDDLKRCRAAAIYYCAARLVPAVARHLSVTTQARDMSYTRQAMAIEDRIAELRALADKELYAVATPSDNTPRLPTMFARKSGTRGK